MSIKNLLLSLWCIPCMLLITSCSKEDEPDPPGPEPYVIPDPPAHGSVADRTVLLYMGGDNNLGRDGFAYNDLSEIGAAIVTLNNDLYSHNNLLVFYDQYSATEHPKLYRVIKKAEVKASDTDPDGAMVITAVEELIYEFPQEITFTQPDIMKEVIDKAFTEFPAKSYGFLYWSHGEGWIPGKYENLAVRSTTPLRWMGTDWNNKSADYKMGIPELAAVLKQAPKKFDYIMFDACFMLSLEVAYELKDCTDYIISSPTETPGPGAPYDQVVPMMFTSSEAAIKMAEAYFKYYSDKYNPNVENSNANWTGGVSMGVLDCTKLDKLAEVTKANLAAAPDLIWHNIAFDYDKRGINHVGYYDVVQLMEKALVPSGLEEWKKAFQEALPYWRTTPKNYSSAPSVKLFSMEGTNGVSHYIPAGGYSADRDAEYRNTSWYKAAGLSKLGW